MQGYTGANKNTEYLVKFSQFNLNFQSLEVVSEKWLKMYVICEIQVPIYLCVLRLNAYYTVNSSLSGVIQGW